MFRPTRRVSALTWVMTLLALVAAAGATAAFLVVILPSRLATLGTEEASELSTGRAGAAAVATSNASVWADLNPGGPFALSADKVTADLALAATAQKQANDALTHVQNASAYLTEAAGVPFQFHVPAYLKTDRPEAAALQANLVAAQNLSQAAVLQLTFSQTVAADQQIQSNQLDPALAQRRWADAARAAASLQTALQSEQLAATNQYALLDPLWSAWVNARFAYAQTAQSYALNAASGQSITAQQLQQTLATEAQQIQAAQLAAVKDVSTWAASKITPLLTAQTPS